MAKVEVRRALHSNFIQHVIIPRVSVNVEKEYLGRYKMQPEARYVALVLFVFFSFLLQSNNK